MHEAAVIVAAFSWSAGFVISRPLLAHLSVFRTNLLRLLPSALIFPILLMTLGLGSTLGEFGWHNYAALIASAFAGIGLADAGMIHSMRLIGLARAYTLGNFATLFAVLWAWLILDEAVSLALVWAALITVGGVALVTSRGGAGQGESEFGTRRFWLGVALASGVAAVWGLDLVLIRIGIGDGHPVAANAVRMPASLVVAGIALLAREPPGTPRRMPTRAQTLRGLLGGAVGITFSASLIFFAIQEIGAARVGVLAALSPVFGLLLATLFLDEKPSRRQALGVIVAVGGVILLLTAA